ncbi:Snurportin-1 [Sergentomyia squamirostris]
MDDIFVNKYRQLYKSSGWMKEGQSQRRRQMLEEQKRQRAQKADENRMFLAFIQKHQAQKQKAASANFDRFYANKLQLSEWMRERPEDLDNWYIVPCPKGKRCLIVANDRTTVYNKAGKVLNSFRSSLEGGKYVTVLDCIYNGTRKEYHVLDCLVYRNQEFIHCETSFRFFWLTSKFLEYDHTVIHRDNHYPFHFIPRFDCADEASLAEALNTYPQWPDNIPTLDGYLFYHKESSYAYGTTPLVLWLFSYMIPEILNTTSLHENYKNLPDGYTTALEFMDDFDRKQKLKRRGKNRAGRKMEVEEGEQSVEIDQQRQLELGELDMDHQEEEEGETPLEEDKLL